MSHTPSHKESVEAAKARSAAAVDEAGKTTQAKRALIIQQLKNLTPEQTEKYLREACDTHLTPDLPLDVFEAFVAKCTPEAVQILRDRLTARGQTDKLARLQAVIDQDPNRV